MSITPDSFYDDHKAVHLGRGYDLVWIDLGYDAAGDRPISEFERCRRFKHCGGAIAWARRKIFHGDLFGDSIEMRTLAFTGYGERVVEEEVEVVDITLAGFCRWKSERSFINASQSISLGRPERKCRTASL